MLNCEGFALSSGKMAGKQIVDEGPVFYVIRVDDGQAFGLLLEKTAAQGAEPDRAYFYFRPGSGAGRATLAPPPGVRRTSEHFNLKPTAELSRLIHELAEYTRVAYEHGNNRVRQPLSQDHPGKGYPDTLSAALRKKACPFARFVGGAKIFSERVLNQVRGEKIVEGRAKGGFRVCPPNTPYLFSEQFEFLETAEEVLEVGRTRRAEWFRRRGPVLCDFQAGRVYPGPDLDTLKTSVKTHCVTTAVGAGGTGKTVLARHLVYDLYKDGRPVYWCRHRRRLDFSAMLAEIHSVCGLIILDDAHRDWDIYEELFRRARLNTARHLLLLARYPPSELARREESALHKPCLIPLRYGDTARGILSQFSAAVGPLRHDTCEQILSFAKGNLWLLAYAAKGAIASGAHGGVKAWVKDGVLKDLQDLERCELEPRVLVAAAPIAMHEEPVAARYLTQIHGFSRNDINNLVRMGELTRDYGDDDTYYGLPHATLGEVYWWAGCYRPRAMDSEQCVVAYLRTHSENGARLLCRAAPASKRWWNELNENEQVSLLRAERDLGYVALWMMSEDALLIHEGTLHMFARRMGEIASCAELLRATSWFSCGAGGYWTALIRVEREIDAHAIAEVVDSAGNTEVDLQQIVSVIGWLAQVGEAGARLCREIDLARHAARVDECACTDLAIKLIEVVCATDRNVGERLWKRINRDRVAGMVSREKWVPEVGTWVRILGEASPVVAREMCDLLDTGVLVESIRNTGKKYAEWCLNAIDKVHPERSAQIRMLLLESIAGGEDGG